MSGPPARPSLRGTDMPGMANGMEPHTIPKKIPMKRVMRLGSLRRFMELPTRSAKRLMSPSLPTTVMRSPICSRRPGEARRSTPARFTRVTLSIYPRGRRSEPSFTPLYSVLVMSTRRDTTGPWSRSHFFSTSGPMKRTKISSSCTEQTTSTRSPLCISSSECGTIMVPSGRSMREMT